MKPWTAENALVWAARSPSSNQHAFVWAWRGKIVASDGHVIVLQPGTGVASDPTINVRKFLNGLARTKLLRSFCITDRFRSWLAKCAQAPRDGGGAVVVSIHGRSFNARLLHHAVKLAPPDAKLALQRGGRLEPAHVLAHPFRAVVMPMRNDPPRIKRRRWP